MNITEKIQKLEAEKARLEPQAADLLQAAMAAKANYEQATDAWHKVWTRVDVIKTQLKVLHEMESEP